MGLAPGYFTLGCGAFAFEKPGLARFREAAAGPDGRAMAATLDWLVDDGIRLTEPALKRVPAPYDRDHPRGSAVRSRGNPRALKNGGKSRGS